MEFPCGSHARDDQRRPCIWDTWENGTKLDFRGDFYQHTLMTPFFTPNASDLAGFGVPKIFIAAVGNLMTEVAGETCDGVIVHGFTTERYIREVTIPALEKGREKAGKTMDGFQISGPLFVVTGNNEDEMKQAAQATKQQMRLWLDTCLPTGARTPWMGRNARRTQPPLESRRLGEDGRSYRRRNSQHLCRRW